MLLHCTAGFSEEVPELDVIWVAPYILPEIVPLMMPSLDYQDNPHAITDLHGNNVYGIFTFSLKDRTSGKLMRTQKY